MNAIAQQTPAHAHAASSSNDFGKGAPIPMSRMVRVELQAVDTRSGGALLVVVFALTALVGVLVLLMMPKEAGASSGLADFVQLAREPLFLLLQLIGILLPHRIDYEATFIAAANALFARIRA